MDKIEIISTTVNDIIEVLNQDLCDVVFSGTTAVCVVVSLIVMAIVLSKEQILYTNAVDKIIPIIVGVLAVTSPVWGMLIGFAVQEKAIVGEEYIYEMYIPDDVPLNEFLDKYEIISRDGNNCTAREVLMYDEPREITNHNKSANVKGDK